MLDICFEFGPIQKALVSSSFETKDERFDSVVVVKTGSGMGSGFFISEDEILTNYHDKER